MSQWLTQYSIQAHSERKGMWKDRKHRRKPGLNLKANGSVVAMSALIKKTMASCPLERCGDDMK